MTRDELRRAIERPAERVGLSVEPELVDTLLARRRGPARRAAAAVDGAARALALARRAPPAARRLRAQRRRAGRGRPAGRGRVPRARPGRAGGGAQAAAAAERRGRRAARSCAGGSRSTDLEPELAEVAGRLADRRLLTISDGAVEVAHEALLREWPRLRGWLDEDVQGRRLHRQLSDAARAWDADGRDPGGLYRGARLAAALDWAAGHDSELDATERAFLDDSRRASGRAQRRLRAGARGRRLAAGGRCRRRRPGARAARQRARRGDRGRGAAPRRAGARGGRSRPRAAARPSGRRARRLGADARQPVRHAAQEPGGDRRARGDGERRDRPRPQPRRAHAGVRRCRRGALAASTRRRGVRIADPRLVPGVTDSVPGFDALRFSGDGSRLAVGGWQPQCWTPPACGRSPSSTRRLQSTCCASHRTVARSSLPVSFAPGSSVVQRFDAGTGRRLSEPRPVEGPFAFVTPVATADGARVVTSLDRGPTVLRDARTLRPLGRLAPGALGHQLGRPNAAARRQERLGARPRSRDRPGAQGIGTPRRRRHERRLRPGRPYRRDGRRGRARDRVGRRAGRGP